MGVDLGPNKVNDGLVFGYDTGYGVATNSTATRHYSGFPVTNMLSYGAEFDSWTKARNSGSYPTVDVKVAKGPFPSTLADRLSLPSDGSYPRISQNFTPASTATHTFSVWLKGESEGQGCFIGSFRNSPWSSTSTTTFSITTEWVNYSFNITPLDTSTHQLYIGSHNSHGGKVFLMYGALLQTGGTKTVFTDGTRSSTQSLIDLTKTNDIDVSNVSFDSTGQPIFDGTDDYIAVTNLLAAESIGAGTQRTISLWLNCDTYGSRMPFSTGQSGSDRIYYWTENSLNTWRVGNYTSTTGHGSLPSVGNWFNTVLVIDGTNITAYLNGQEDYTGSYTGFTTEHYATFGRHGATSSYHYDGKIANAKIYDRALSAAEVKQNYNAYRKRFNL